MWGFLCFILLLSLVFNQNSHKSEKPQKQSKEESKIGLAQSLLRLIGINGFQEYIEKNKIIISIVLKEYDQKKKLKWEYRDTIVKEIVEEMKKKEKIEEKTALDIALSTVDSDLIDTTLMYYLLYLKKDNLSELIEISHKKIVVEVLEKCLS